MSAIVIGFLNPGAGGGVQTFDGPLVGTGSFNIDAAVGAFTGVDGLPTSVDDEADFQAFVTALLAKATEVNDAGVSIANHAARRFVGVGGGGNDTIGAQNTDDGRFYGRGGDDRLASLSGTTEDTLDGGDGADRLWGGGGNDSIVGGAGDDTLLGATGDDTLRGGDGVDLGDYSHSEGALFVSLAIFGPHFTGPAAWT